MPDITMCSNNLCPSNQKCYRYMATPSKWMQSYADFKPNDGEDKCDYYVKHEEEKSR